MNILVIDYLSYSGHRNFNRIHLGVLLNMGHTLTLVGKKGHFDEYGGDSKVKVYYPTQLDNVTPKDSHFKNIINLLKIRNKVGISNYDAILFPTYDVASLFVFRSNKPTYIIDHNTVGMLNETLFGRIRMFLNKTLPSNYYHVCLNKSMEGRLLQLDSNHIIYHVPHGICPPSMKLEKPAMLEDKERFVICPVNRNYDAYFVQAIFESPELSEYLETHNVKLVLKKEIPCNSDCKNIIRIEGNISKEQYDYLIQNAEAVILPYGQRFKYRCSGIFFECMSRKTPVIATDIEELRQYEDTSDLYFFNNVKELLEGITQCHLKGARDFDYEIYNPNRYWEYILASKSYK